MENHTIGFCCVLSDADTQIRHINLCAGNPDLLSTTAVFYQSSLSSSTTTLGFDASSSFLAAVSANMQLAT